MIILDPVPNEDIEFSRAGTATYVNGVGQVASAGANVLRIGYDYTYGTGPAQPILEPAAANKYTLTESADLNGTTARTFVYPNHARSPDNNWRADLLFEEASTGQHRWLVGMNVAEGAETTFAIFVKALGRTKVKIQTDIGSGAYFNAVFDLATGTEVSRNAAGSGPSITDARIYALADGWFRISITGRITVVGATFLFNTIFLLDAAGADSYAGDGGSGVLLWGLDGKEGALSTYIASTQTHTGRGSVAWYFDVAGDLQQASSGVARSNTYDAASLVNIGMLLESAAINGVRNNTMAGAVSGSPGTDPNFWTIVTPTGITKTNNGVGTENGVDYVEYRFQGIPVANSEIHISFEANNQISSGSSGERWVASAFVRLISGSTAGTSFRLTIDQYDTGGGIVAGGPELVLSITGGRISARRYAALGAVVIPGSHYVKPVLYSPVTAGVAVNITLRVGLPQIEKMSGGVLAPSSPIKTSTAAVTRAADLYTSTAGTRAADVRGNPDGTIVYSNVPEDDYPAYAPGTSYLENDRVVYQHGIYQRLAAGAGAGYPPTDTTRWVYVSATNRYMMFDGINNTYTENPESIIVVATPRAVAKGLFLGGLDASYVQIVVFGPDGSVIDEEVTTLVSNTSQSSYWYWAFERIKRRNAEVWTDLPTAYDGMIAININNPGSIARCAMCLLGPLIDLGITQYGLGRDIVDYSDEVFDVDGTSTTTLRGYAKGMNVDVKVENPEIDDLVDTLENYRQKSVVWIGVKSLRHTFVYGKYGSFKTVIEDRIYSRCSLTIKGKL